MNSSRSLFECHAHFGNIPWTTIGWIAWYILHQTVEDLLHTKWSWTLFLTNNFHKGVAIKVCKRWNLIRSYRGFRHYSSDLQHVVKKVRKTCNKCGLSMQWSVPFQNLLLQVLPICHRDFLPVAGTEWCDGDMESRGLKTTYSPIQMTFFNGALLCNRLMKLPSS